MIDDERKPHLADLARERGLSVEDVPWLVKDFDVLYRAALDVSESLVEPERETPPQRYLRAQLARLRPAFDDVRFMKTALTPQTAKLLRSCPRTFLPADGGHSPNYRDGVGRCGYCGAVPPALEDKLPPTPGEVKR